MCERISDNLWPCNARPSSKISAFSLVTSIASGALAAVAIARHWGMPAVGALSTVSGLSFVITLSIISCRETPDWLEEAPFPSDLIKDFNFHKGPENAEVSSPHAKAVKIKQELLQLANHSKTDAFKLAISQYRSDSFAIDIQDNDIPLENPIESTDGKTRQLTSSFLDIILQSTETRFIKILLKKCPDGSITAHPPALFLRVTDPVLIAIVIKKIRPQDLQALIESALKDKTNKLWLESVIGHYNQIPKQCGITPEWLCKEILQTKALSSHQKCDLMQSLDEWSPTPLKDLKFNVSFFNGSGFEKISTGSALDIAINNNDIDLAKTLISRWQPFLNQLSEGDFRVTPLMRAIMIHSNQAMVALIIDELINSGQQEALNQIFEVKHLGESQLLESQYTHMNPIRMAHYLGLDEITNLLIHHQGSFEMFGQEFNLTLKKKEDYFS